MRVSFETLDAQVASQLNRIIQTTDYRGCNRPKTQRCACQECNLRADEQAEQLRGLIEACGWDLDTYIARLLGHTDQSN